MTVRVVLATSATFPFLRKSFEAAQKFGIGVEVLAVPWRPKQPQKIFELSRRYSVQVVGVHAPIITNLKHGWKFVRGFGLLENLISLVWLTTFFPGQSAEIAQKVGAEYIVTHALTIQRAKPDVLARVRKSTTLLVENALGKVGPPNRFTGGVRLAAEVSKQNGLGTALDTVHVGLARFEGHHYNMVETFHQLQPEVVHLADLGGNENQQALVPGDGNLPLRDLLIEIRNTGWVEVIVIEITSKISFPFFGEKLYANVGRALDFIKEAGLL